MITQTALQFIRKRISMEERLDDRGFDEFRKITIERGFNVNAEGSARVKIGDTEVVAGVKLQVGEPFKDAPNEGILITTAEYLPTSSVDIEPGPPGVDEIEIGRVIDRGIREGKVIDLSKLCLVEGEKVWIIFLDLYLVNDAGNVYDAMSLAAINALLDAKIPKVDENYEIIEGEYSGELPINHKVLSLTAYKIGDKILYDPNDKEESVVDARLTVGVRDDGKIVSLQKSLDGSFTMNEVKEIIKRNREIALKMMKKYVM